MSSVASARVAAGDDVRGESTPTVEFAAWACAIAAIATSVTIITKSAIVMVMSDLASLSSTCDSATRMLRYRS